MSDSVQPHRRSPPGSPIPGTLQARTLEWAAIYGVSQSWAWLKQLSSSSSIHALIIETDAFKNIVSFNPTVELEEVIIVPILQPKKLWFGGKIRPDTKQISEANLNLKSFHSIACMLNHFSYVLFFAILWTIACQGPLSMGFSRQECWSGLPRPPPADLPNPVSEPMSLLTPALVGRFFTTSAAWEAPTPIQGIGKYDKIWWGYKSLPS